MSEDGFKLINVLRKYRADPSIKNEAGDSAIDVAKKIGNIKLVALLRGELDEVENKTKKQNKKVVDLDDDEFISINLK